MERGTVAALLGKHGKLTVLPGHESCIDRILTHDISTELFDQISKRAAAFGVTERFMDVIRKFQVPVGQTPAGFRVEYELFADGLVKADLVRDIAYDQNGRKRPSEILFSADSANPYEVESMRSLIGNLTCNPAIIYNQFINNPKA